MVNDIVQVAVDAYHGNVTKYSVGDSMQLLQKALVEANNGSTKLNYKAIRDGKCVGLFALVEEILMRTVVEGLQGDEYFNSLVVLSVDLGKQEAQRILKQLESAIASQDITIKIAKIDASKPVADLKKQLTTMLSGLSITGLREFIGADGASESYEKAAKAADKLAEAQENVRRKSEAANASVKVLNTLQSQLNSIFKSATNVGNSDKLESFIATYRELMSAAESARNMQGDAQNGEAKSQA